MRKWATTKLQLSFLAIILVSIVIYFTFKQIPESYIQDFLIKSGPWAPLIYILLHQISYVFAPISGLPFLLVGYSLFAERVVIYSYLIVLLGSAINFWLAKRWGRPLVVKMTGKEAVAKIDRLTQNYGIMLLIALRILHGGIGDYVSYAYGLTNMRFATYYLTTVLATIPGQLIWYYLASQSKNIEQFIVLSLSMSILATVIFVTGNYLLKRKSRS